MFFFPSFTVGTSSRQTDGTQRTASRSTVIIRASAGQKASNLANKKKICKLLSYLILYYIILYYIILYYIILYYIILYYIILYYIMGCFTIRVHLQKIT